MKWWNGVTQFLKLILFEVWCNDEKWKLETYERHIVLSVQATNQLSPESKFYLFTSIRHWGKVQPKQPDSTFQISVIIKAI